MGINPRTEMGINPRTEMGINPRTEMGINPRTENVNENDCITVFVILKSH
jgi:hypothetical protein